MDGKARNLHHSDPPSPSVTPLRPRSQLWWVRPPWADQLPDGDHAFHVGVEAKSGHLRCVVALPSDGCNPRMRGRTGGRLDCPDASFINHISPLSFFLASRVTCPDVYYLDEGLYAPRDAMDAQQPCRPLRLKVGLAKVSM